MSTRGQQNSEPAEEQNHVLVLILFLVQERIAKAHGSQCGFCTPGIVMSMYALLRNNPTPNMSDVEEAFHGTAGDGSAPSTRCSNISSDG